MLILTMPGEINTECGKILGKQFNSENTQFQYPFDPFLSWRNIQEQTMLVIDLGDKNYCLEKLDPYYWSGELINRQLPIQLKDLYLISSSLIADKNLFEFANNLAKFFKEKYQRTINVHVPASLKYDFTVVIPPIEHEEWQVFGIKKNKVDKKLLWQGKDILKWLNEPERCFNGTTYAWKND